MLQRTPPRRFSSRSVGMWGNRSGRSCVFCLQIPRSWQGKCVNKAALPGTSFDKWPLEEGGRNAGGELQEFCACFSAYSQNKSHLCHRRTCGIEVCVLFLSSKTVLGKGGICMLALCPACPALEMNVGHLASSLSVDFHLSDFRCTFCLCRIPMDPEWWGDPALCH